jgi:hypothetical protein
MSMVVADVSDLRERLGAAASIKDISERHLEIAAILTEALQSVGVHPIVVGGAAVEFFTGGEYATGDLDLIAPEGRELAVVMSALGFEKRGKSWTHEAKSIFVEFPSPMLRAGEEWITLRVGGTDVRIVSSEDLVVERLRSYKFWGATVDAVNALVLMGAVPSFDAKRAALKASKEDVRDAFDGIAEILKRLQRGAVTETHSNGMIEALLEKIRPAAKPTAPKKSEK